VDVETNKGPSQTDRLAAGKEDEPVQSLHQTADRRGEPGIYALNQQRAREELRFAGPPTREFLQVRADGRKIFHFSNEQLTPGVASDRCGDVLVAKRIVSTEMDQRAVASITCNEVTCLSGDGLMLPGNPFRYRAHTKHRF